MQFNPYFDPSSSMDRRRGGVIDITNELEPAPLSLSINVVPTMNELPSSLTQNPDDYLILLSKLTQQQYYYANSTTRLEYNQPEEESMLLVGVQGFHSSGFDDYLLPTPIPMATRDTNRTSLDRSPSRAVGTPPPVSNRRDGSSDGYFDGSSLQSPVLLANRSSSSSSSSYPCQPYHEKSMPMISPSLYSNCDRTDWMDDF